MTKKITPFRILELLVFVLLVGIIGYQQYDNSVRTEMRERDIARISSINQIRFALSEYKDEKGFYPPCLYKTTGCESLEGSSVLPQVARDPLTDKPFAYAAFGSGNTCTGFHVGASLERTASQALLLGADATPKPDSALCKGSAPDFSGLSYAPGGEPCNLKAGTAQPTNASDGETCFEFTEQSE